MPMVGALKHNHIIDQSSNFVKPVVLQFHFSGNSISLSGDHLQKLNHGLTAG